MSKKASTKIELTEKQIWSLLELSIEPQRFIDLKTVTGIPLREIGQMRVTGLIEVLAGKYAITKSGLKYLRTYGE